MKLTEQLKLEEKNIYRYLGIKGDRVDNTTADMVRAGIEEVLATIQPRYGYGLYTPSFNSSAVLLDNSGVALEGKNISKHLAGASKVALMAATLGIEVERLIRRYSATSMTKTLVYDSICTEAIEKVCDRVQANIVNLEENKGYHSNSRFSPGYGDLPLEVQPKIIDSLKAYNIIGLSCTNDYILIPRKSVTALFGFLKQPVQMHRTLVRYVHKKVSANERRKVCIVGILDDLKERILLVDGAMGTMLQKYGLQVGELPELLNITKPDIVERIHREFVEAGADIITANTFQANDLKISGEYSVEEIIAAGIKLAKKSGAKYVALDVGPLGQIFEPLGTFTFEQAYDMFAKQIVAAEKAGADVIIVETLMDLYEAKIALLAAKENTNLPVFCTLTFQENGRTFMGCDPLTQVTTLVGLGVDAVGANCSLGPSQLATVVEEFLKYSPVPVMLQANAGLPDLRDGKTIYNVTAEEFLQANLPLLEAGVQIIGGCCGTTPQYIALLREAVDKLKPKKREVPTFTAVASGSKTVILDAKVSVIGERINPTGKKKLKEALRNNQIDYVLSEAIDQAEAGSDILDVNIGLPDINEPETMVKIIKEIQAVTNLPLQVDSADTKTLEAGARIYNGKPLINSVNGKAESMAEVFPIVKKYGAAVVGLTLDEAGIPETAEERFAIAEKILKTALSYGIAKENILIDCLVLTASAQQDQALETLRAVSMVKERLGLKTALGVSNISFGLPSRSLVNSTFLAAALGAGLDAPILNPLSSEYMDVIAAFKVLNGQDKRAEKFIADYGNITQTAAVLDSAINKEEQDLITLILQGRKESSAEMVAQMLKAGTDPLEIINDNFSVALDIIGDRFAKQEIFLPQLMQSAETVQAGFRIIKEHLSATGSKSEHKGKIAIATVKGDIHDIGKNIVSMMLENHGYMVFDLGKDVDSKTIIDTIKANDIQLVGLSALMTTTVSNMKTIVKDIRAEGIDAKIMVGGAVLNEEYTEFVGADYYAKDALEGISIAKKVFDAG